VVEGEIFSREAPAAILAAIAVAQQDRAPVSLSGQSEGASWVI